MFVRQRCQCSWGLWLWLLTCWFISLCFLLLTVCFNCVHMMNIDFFSALNGETFLVFARKFAVVRFTFCFTFCFFVFLSFPCIHPDTHIYLVTPPVQLHHVPQWLTHTNTHPAIPPCSLDSVSQRPLLTSSFLFPLTLILPVPSCCHSIHTLHLSVTLSHVFCCVLACTVFPCKSVMVWVLCFQFALWVLISS